MSYHVEIPIGGLNPAASMLMFFAWFYAHMHVCMYACIRCCDVMWCDVVRRDLTWCDVMSCLFVCIRGSKELDRPFSHVSDRTHKMVIPVSWSARFSYLSNSWLSKAMAASSWISPPLFPFPQVRIPSRATSTYLGNPFWELLPKLHFSTGIAEF
jgi:hypothetical protein